MALKIDANFEGKLTCALKNDMKNLTNLHRLKQMNSTYNKTFYTCLTEPLFLKLDPHLPKFIFICFNDSPSKTMKIDFYFILKALFVPQIFKFCLEFLVM